MASEAEGDVTVTYPATDRIDLPVGESHIDIAAGLATLADGTTSRMTSRKSSASPWNMSRSSLPRM